ncbi:MAG: glycosyltransferase family 2 protein, partial [Candidatus Woesebacteria bacterium]
MKVDLSIIIVSFNTKKLTLACIDSIVKNTKGVGYEIIAVDNASTDESVASLKNLNLKKGVLKVIENDENRGFASANNQGIKKSGGEYVLLLNSDTQVKKGSIESLLSFAEKKEDAGAVVPKLLNSDGSTQPSVFRFPTIKGAVRQYFLQGENYLDKYYPAGKEPTVVDATVMAALLITPKALEKVGFLDERYFMYFEDLDYCRRIKEGGLKVYYYPDSEV